MDEGEAILNNESLNKRNLSIDLLKFLAISFVIFTHLFPSDFRKVLLFPFHIDMAVPIFMIITGYNNYKSCKARNLDSVREWFSKKNIVSKFKRICIPFFVLIAIELIINVFVRDMGFLSTVKSIVKESGLGPGGYYFTVLIQVLFIFPFLYLNLDKKPCSTIVFILIFCLIYEIIVKYLGIIPPKVYRIIGIRYFPTVMVGMLFAKYEKSIKMREAVIALFAGALFIVCMNYTQYKPLIFSQWITTAFPASLYAFFFVFVACNYVKINSRIIRSIITLCGQASYHIFIAQMLYFYYIHSILWNILAIKTDALLRVILFWIFCFIACMTLGIAFYALDELILHKRNVIKNIFWEND